MAKPPFMKKPGKGGKKGMKKMPGAGKNPVGPKTGSSKV